MCGDLDEDDGVGDVLCGRFLSHAAALRRTSSGGSGGGDPVDLDRYLDALFGDALERCIRDVQAAEGRPYEVLGSQPLAFARLAGFLAGHLSLREDPLRKVIEAMMHGYAEAEQIEADHGHDHDHEHGHAHPGHAHAHAHDHHH